MPLVTVTAARGFILPEHFIPDEQLSAAQLMVVRFGRDLPELIYEHGAELRLDDETPAEAVQVKHESFGPYDQNHPAVWVLVGFTEEAPAEVVRKSIRQSLVEIVTGWFETYAESAQAAMHFDLAIDVFWGPGHGVITDRELKVIQDW